MKKPGLMLLAALGLALGQYRDLSPNQLEWQAVQALTQMGVLYGYPDGTFGPDRVVVRKELALALYRLWLKAKEESNQGLQELAQKLAQTALGLSQGQAALEERLKALEASRLSPEELEDLRAEVAAFRSSMASLEEGLARLTDQYYSLVKSLEGVRAKTAEIDQRSLAWNEDAVNLQKGLDGLTASLKDLEARMGSLEAALASRLREAEGRLQSGIGQAEDRFRSQVDGLRGDLQGLRENLSKLEELLVKTREEVFRLAEDLKKTKAELTARMDRIEKAPPPLVVGAALSGFNPLVLGVHAAYENLLGLGVRVGGDYHAGTGEALVQGLFYLPVYRYPANASVGFGLSYAVSGPYQGLVETVALVGLGVDMAAGIEGYGEARFFYPLDGSPTRARIGLGLRFRLGGM